MPGSIASNTPLLPSVICAAACCSPRNRGSNTIGLLCAARHCCPAPAAAEPFDSSWGCTSASAAAGEGAPLQGAGGPSLPGHKERWVAERWRINHCVPPPASWPFPSWPSSSLLFRLHVQRHDRPPCRPALPPPLAEGLEAACLLGVTACSRYLVSIRVSCARILSMTASLRRS